MDYTYTLDQFPNGKFDLSKLTKEIGDASIKTSLDFLSGEEENIIIHFKAELSTYDWATLSGIVAGHDGENDGIDYQPVKIIGSDDNIHLNTHLYDEFRDRSGKMRVHQTSRKLGTMIVWTGEGDDVDNPSAVGNGESFSFSYTVGQEEPLVKYIDFNVVENETWLHEGYVTWSNCYLDTLNLSLVSMVTDTVTSSGTDYAIMNGYLIVPIYTVGGTTGDGVIDITSDITLATGGLVYMPNDDQNNNPTAFWNADWNTTTKRYENIMPAPTGNGRYNMFSVEISFAEFVRKIPLLDSGFIALNSSDTDQLGHGMRLKMTADTNTTISGVGDHDWAVACTMCLHRKKSV